MTRLTDRQLEWLIRQAQGTARPLETVGQMAARLGVSIRWLRKLRQRWRQSGQVPRLDPRRRPRSPPLSPAEAQLIEAEYRVNPRGATMVFLALRRQGHPIPKMRIYRYMLERRWVKPNRRKQRRRTRVRYERAHSGSLLHGDFHRTSLTHPHCILWLDDASRKILAGGEFPTPTAEAAIATLQSALTTAAEWNLDIREVNTDRGAQFFCTTRSDGRWGEAQFQRFLHRRGIHHVVSRVRNPQTNGKLERLWLEYDRHRWRYGALEEWMSWQNRQIHGALRLDLFETPQEAWQRKLPPEVLLGLHLRSVEGALT